MKLKIKSLYNEIKDSLYLILFIIVPVIIILNCTNIKNIIIPFIILVIFIFSIFKQNKKIIFLTIFITTVFLIPIILNEITYKKINNNFNNKPFNDKCEITDIIEYQTYRKITFKKNKIYFFGNINNNLINEKLLIGMEVKLVGTLTKPNEYFLDKDFNYRIYLKKQKIIGIIKIDKIEITSKNIIFKKDNYKNINLLLNRYIDKIHNYESKSFIKNLTLGSNSLDSTLKNNLNKMGISHLFVVSGMHFSLLIILFDKLYKLPLFNKIKSKKIIKICYLFLYVIITKLSISIVRCFLQNIIKMYNDKLKLNKFNQFTLSLIIAIIIQPLSIFNRSFHLTYLISGSIVLLNDLLSKQKNKIIQTVILTLSLNLIILPFISDFNGEINLLIIIFNIIYIPIVSYIMFPLSFLILIFPFLNKIYYILYQIFIKSIFLLTNNSLINIFNITLPKITPFIILIYYIVLIILFKTISIKKKQILSFITLLIVLIIWNNFGYFKNNTTCEFLNVKIGDVTIIKEKYLKQVILVDTGDDEEIISYLKKEGIKKIDYIIISHPDSDHYGQLNNIIKNFKVKKVIISCYDDKTIKIVSKNKIKIIYANQKILLGNIILWNLGPIKNYGNTNDNSLVFILKISNTSILFTGDITKNAENDLIKKYKINVDILKVAHHGSNTSSSNIFLENIKFKLAVAMNGYQNNYGFPSDEVVKRFKKYKFHNTLIEGTILFIIK